MRARNASAPSDTHEVRAYGEVDDVFHYCFLCVKENERAEEKALREMARAEMSELEYIRTAMKMEVK